MLPAMAGRSPARFLAPLALVAFAVALVMILSHGSGDNGAEQPVSGSSPAATATPAKHHRKRKFYVVKPGDTPSGIAEKTGVSLDLLLELNPNLDPQTLTPGERLKLRR